MDLMVYLVGDMREDQEGRPLGSIFDIRHVWRCHAGDNMELVDEDPH